jgi:hypothetical protein
MLNFHPPKTSKMIKVLKQNAIPVLWEKYPNIILRKTPLVATVIF